ncbi:MAG: ChaN family lipoprotein [Planctomycetota bacterium]
MFRKRIPAGLVALAAVLLLLGALFLLRGPLALAVFKYFHEKARAGYLEKAGTLKLPELSPALETELSAFLVAHYQNPIDYIVRKFEDHDIVFVGERHRVKHQLELLHGLIRPLYDHDVFTLGLEFADYVDQDRIDRLVTAPTYDESLARSILFNFSAFWGYQEYVDIFRVAWELNRSLPEGSRTFRVLGLNAYEDWSHVRSHRDLGNPAIMRRVRPEGDGDEVMARNVLVECVEQGEKALIYSGLHHAFTRYKQPVYDANEQKFVGFVQGRMGNLVFDAVGERAMTIVLHSPWWSEQGENAQDVYPADGIIDALMSRVAPQYREVGFDTRGTPFGSLTGNMSVYKHGYPHFTLQDFCDGYVYQKPLREFQGVTPIVGFINRENFSQAVDQIHTQVEYRWLVRLIGPQAFDAAVGMDADIDDLFCIFEHIDSGVTP